MRRGLESWRMSKTIRAVVLESMDASRQTMGQTTGQCNRTRDTRHARRAFGPWHRLPSLFAIPGHPRRASAGRRSQPSVPSRNRNGRAVHNPQRAPKAGAPPHGASGATACRHTRPTSHATAARASRYRNEGSRRASRRPNCDTQCRRQKGSIAI